MSRILLYSHSGLERRVTADILARGLAGAEARPVASRDEAIAALAESAFDLFIADVYHFDLHNMALIADAAKMAPDMPVLLTAAMPRPDISAYVWQMPIRDYLLKPYRPEWLLSTVAVLTGRRAGGLTRGERRLKSQLELMRECLCRFQYKKCMDLSRKCLDLVYGDIYNDRETRTLAQSFLRGLAALGGAFGPGAQARLAAFMGRLAGRADWPGSKHAADVACEGLLAITFEAMDSGRYEVPDGQRMLNLVDRSLKKALSLDEVAEYAGMSPTYFSKVFKKLTGENYIAYVTAGKMEEAKRLLAETDLPVKNVAYELSFRETNYFSRAFKKHTGQTPLEYREGAAGQKG